MSDSEDLPDIDDVNMDADGGGYKINYDKPVKPLHSRNASKDTYESEVESVESDLEVIWEGNSSQSQNKSSEEILLPDLPNSPQPSSSSVLKSKSKNRANIAVKESNPILLSDSSEEEDALRAKKSVRVMLPKKAKRRPNSAENEDDKEKKRLEKEKEKEIKRLERERKKMEEERAKGLRKAASQVQKSGKPGESIKHMTVILDSVITEKYDALIPLMVCADIKYEVESNPLIESSIHFKRELMQQAMGDDLKIKIISKFVDEDQIIVLLDSDKVIPMAYVQLNKGSSGSDGADDENELDLITWVESVKSLFSGKKLTLFLYDMEKYFKKIKKNTQQEFRNRVLNAGNVPVRNKRKQKSNLPDVSQTELNGSLIEMQLQTGVNYRMIKNVSQLGSFLNQYTKAIAEAPFKKQRIESNGFDWFALADATGSVKVEKDGSGLKQLWIEQLQQFTSIGPDMALSISNRYPSPIKLLEAYKSCNNQEEGESLLKDLTVVSGIGPLARTRRIGPESSKKLYRFFTSTNGDRFLGSTLDSR